MSGGRLEELDQVLEQADRVNAAREIAAGCGASLAIVGAFVAGILLVAGVLGR